ncbi:MAG: RluA family pseudouridine synthase [Eubacteriales bacterium]|nr:RluA family pseudouridine synthase [Eubacteriales bacterium]
MNEEKLLFTVEAEDEDVRIDAWLAGNIDGMSRSYLQKIVKEGGVAVNGKIVKANYKLRENDEIRVSIPENKEPDIEPENIPLDILYEDSSLLVVNKPKDMVVHPAAGHYSHTLVNALLYHCHDELSGINGILRPGIVHRIDKDTTGALVVCKTDSAHRKLAEQLSVHSITRRYRAIVHGNIAEDELTITGNIGRHPTDRKKMAVVPEDKGKPAVTHVKVLERLRGYTYVECSLETGRTHQIRVHMTKIGHPLLGDEVYGTKKCPVKGLQGQTLHARILGFVHPETGKYMEFEAPLPEYFQELLRKLSV